MADIGPECSSIRPMKYKAYEVINKKVVKLDEVIVI